MNPSVADYRATYLEDGGGKFHARVEKEIRETTP
jgi:hypothetical protein